MHRTLIKGVTETMKRLIVLSLALIVVVSSVALADGVGAFSAFKNGIGARALAMGGAFVAVADDATAVYWNPAGLAQVADTRIAGMSTDL
jgi:long-chain fatty acid transport protein